MTSLERADYRQGINFAKVALVVTLGTFHTRTDDLFGHSIARRTCLQAFTVHGKPTQFSTDLFCHTFHTALRRKCAVRTLLNAFAIVTIILAYETAIGCGVRTIAQTFRMTFHFA